MRSTKTTVSVLVLASGTWCGLAAAVADTGKPINPRQDQRLKDVAVAQQVVPGDAAFDERTTREAAENTAANGPTISLVPVESPGPHNINGNEIVIPGGGHEVTLEIRLSGWGSATGAPELGTYQAYIDSSGYSSGDGAPLGPKGWPGSPEDGAFIDEAHTAPPFVFAGFTCLTPTDTSSLDYGWGGHILFDGGKPDDGQVYYGGTLILEVPAGAVGTYTIEFNPSDLKTFMRDDGGTTIAPLTLTPAQITVVLPDPEIKLTPVSATVPHTAAGNEIVLAPGGGEVTLEIQLTGWGSATGAPELGTYQAFIDSSSYSSGDGAPLSPKGWPGSPADGAFVDEAHTAPPFVFAGLVCLTATDTSSLDYGWGGTILWADYKPDDGQAYYGGTLILEVPPGAVGTYTIEFNPGDLKTFMHDDIGYNITPVILTPARITVAVPQQWAKTYGGSSADTAYAVQETSDGAYIVAGHTWSFGAGEDDFWILKLDSSGDINWEKTYGWSGTDFARTIRQTADGGFIVAGDAASPNNFWVLRLDSDGDVLWQKTYEDRGHPTSIQQTSDGGYVMSGIVAGVFGGWDAWIAKLDILGNMSWEKAYGGSSQEYVDSVQQTTDGGYVVVGYTGSFGAGRDDIWVLKLDGTGNILWQKAYGGSQSDGVTSIQQTSEGGYIVAAFTWSFGAGSGDIWVLKLDAAGNVSWQKTYGGSDLEGPYSIKQTTDGGYVLAGHTFGLGGSYVDLLALKLDSTGSVSWQKIYGGTGYDHADSVQQTTDGGYVVVGYTGSFGAGGADIWVLKLDQNGEIPDCEIIHDVNVTVSDTFVTGVDTSVIPQPTSTTVTDTGITPETTSAEITVICGEVADPVDPESPAFDKNRYISFVPANPGEQTALRLTLVSMPADPPDYDFTSFEGTHVWVGEPVEICENSGQDYPPVGGCGPAWTGGGPPLTMQSSNLQATQYCHDFGSIGLLHVTDCEIVPGATYHVQAISCAAVPLEGNFSDPLVINTSSWGNICGPYDVVNNRWSAPDTSVDIVYDVTACVDKFKNSFGAPIKPRADIDPNVPDWKINITSDVTKIIDAFGGDPYPFAGPGTCPP